MVIDPLSLIFLRVGTSCACAAIPSRARVAMQAGNVRWNRLRMVSSLKNGGGEKKGSGVASVARVRFSGGLGNGGGEAARDVLQMRFGRDVRRCQQDVV